MRALALNRKVLPSLLLALLIGACTRGSAPQMSTAPASETAEAKALPDSNFHEFTLSNGLTLAVREDHDSPLVAIVTRVGSGYLQETESQSGWSHLLEHMILRGTKTHPGAHQIDSLVARMGGVLNGATTYDHTETFLVVPTEQLNPGLGLMAEIYREPLLDAKVLERERRAVKMEIEQKLEHPIAHARDELLQLMFSRNALGRGQGQSLSALDSLDRDSLLAFHDEQYRPSNTVLSVVGDVDADAVHARVEELLGSMPRGELRRHSAPDEPAPSSLRFTRELGSYDPNLVMVGFPLSVASAGDLPALQVLAQLLVDGSSSRMNMLLKTEGDLIESCSSRIVLNGGTGLFEVLIQAPSKADDQALRTLFTELDRIRRLGVLEEELAAARMRLKNRWWLEREGVLARARIQAAEIGPHGRQTSPDAWDSVGSKEIQQAITRWLQIPRASVVELLNEMTSRARPFYLRLDAAGMQGHLQGAVLAAAQHSQAPIAPAPPPSLHSRLALGGWSSAFAHVQPAGGIYRYQFDNGAVLIVDTEEDSPMCSASLRFRGGRVAEVRNTAGLTSLLQVLMIEQTTTRDPVSLAVELGGLGSSVVPTRGSDSFGFRMEVQGPDLPYALDILCDMASNTVLDNRRFLKAVNDRGHKLRQPSNQLFDSTSELVREAAWGDNGYGIPDLGTLESMRVVSPPRLQEFHTESCNPGNAVIVVTGKVDPEMVRKFLELYMSDWSDASDLYPSGAEAYFSSDLIEPLSAVAADSTVEVHRPDPLAAVQIGFSAPGQRDPLSTSYRLFVAWMKGPESPLRGALRARDYAGPLYLHDQGGALGSLFCLYTVSPSTELDSAQKDLVEAARSAADARLSEKQLARTKSYLATSFLLNKQGLAERDAFLAQREILGLKPESLSDHAADFSAVSLDSVQSLSGKILRGPYAVGRVNGTVSEK